MKVFKFFTLPILIFLFLGIIILSGRTTTVVAQGNPTATPTPNPTIVVLENTIATQQVTIEKLEREQGFEAKEREIGFRDINSQWKSWLAIVGIAGGFLAIFGVKSIRDLWNSIEKAKQGWEENIRKLESEWKQRSQIALDQAVYKLDMANIPILLPENENVGSIHRLLQQRKFEKIKYYKDYNELESGVLVVSLKGKNEEEQKKTLDKFKKFIETQQPSAITTGFIIYSPDRITVPTDVMNCHDNLVTANYPATVVSSIFTVGRGIDITPPV